MACFPKHFKFYLTSNWPDPLSLATTNGVSVDILSSGYLDVSVRQVCFLYLCIQYKMPLKRRVSPFGNPRIKVYSQLPRAYRSVLRPSSPLGAKASTKCTFIAWNIICTEINLHMMIKFSVWWLVKLFQTTLNTLLDLVEVNGIEPMTSCLQSRRSPNWATPPSKNI